MDWRTIYKDKIMTADEAVRHIKSGDHITVAEVGSQPYALTEALERNYEHLENVEVHYLLSLGNPPAAKPGMEKHVRFHGMFLSGATRPLIAENRGEFMPCCFHQ